MENDIELDKDLNKIKKFDTLKKVSHWEKVGELYICGNCKYYTKQAEIKCPKCKCDMISIVEQCKYV